MNKTKKKNRGRGGHMTGFRPIATTTGGGPVYEIRRAANLSQAAMAAAAGCSLGTIRRAESRGGWPGVPAIVASIQRIEARNRAREGKIK